VHFYPEAGEVEKALKALAVYDNGKPLMIEEMFPLACELDDMDEFIRRSETIAEGWMSFYWGRTIGEYESLEQPSIAEAITARWLTYFRDRAQEMRRP
jgi:hypothetical protein